MSAWKRCDSTVGTVVVVCVLCVCVGEAWVEKPWKGVPR